MKKASWITTRKMPLEKRFYAWEGDTSRYNTRDLDMTPGEGLPTFCCRFTPRAELRRAVLRITACGIYDAYINSRPLTSGDGVRDELMPLYTDYHARVMEKEYAVTRYLHPERENRLVVRVSRGWWSGRISFGYNDFENPALLAELELEYANGESELIPSSPDWDAAILGPVLAADIWDGEYFDARLPDPVTSDRGITWERALPFTAFHGEVTPFLGEPVRVRDTHAPKTATVYEETVGESELCYGRIVRRSIRFGDGCEACELKAGEHLLLDFGENLVGRPTLALRAEDGTHVRILFSEMLNDTGERARGNDGPAGSPYVQNYRTAKARLHYVAWSRLGRELNIYRPLHTFFGYRYLEVTADRDIELLTVTTEELGSTVPDAGDFTCSNAEWNRLFRAIRRGMRGNYLSIPTDCPQRDERLGWTGDTQIFCPAACYLADVDLFFEKWLTDARDSQIGYEGAYSAVIPRIKGVADMSAAAWSDAGIICAWRMYEFYGDRDLLARHYSSMEAYMEYLAGRGFEGPGAVFGDWLAYEETDAGMLSLAYYAYDASLMERISRLLSKRERAEHYGKLFRELRARYTERYTENGFLPREASQTAHLVALDFDLLTGDACRAAAAALKEKLRARGCRISTGFVGTGILAETLSKLGEDDLLYSIVGGSEDPSWLYSLRAGATTVWERWNSYTNERGFGDVSMNSFNHYAYGAIAAWFFSGIAGIKPHPERGGFDHPIICPRPDLRPDSEIPEGQERITMADASYHDIRSRWEYENGYFTHTVTIPGGEGDIVFPRFRGESELLLLGNRITPEALGGKTEDTAFHFTLPAGTYTIKSTVRALG